MNAVLDVVLLFSVVFPRFVFCVDMQDVLITDHYKTYWSQKGNDGWPDGTQTSGKGDAFRCSDWTPVIGDALTSYRKKRIIIPSGKFIVRSTVTLPNGSDISGVNQTVEQCSRIIAAPDSQFTGEYIFQGDTAGRYGRHFSVQKLMFDFSVNRKVKGIFFQNVRNHTIIKDNKFDNFNNNVVTIRSPISGYTQNVLIADNVFYGSRTGTIAYVKNMAILELTVANECKITDNRFQFRRDKDTTQTCCLRLDRVMSTEIAQNIFANANGYAAIEIVCSEKTKAVLGSIQNNIFEIDGTSSCRTKYAVSCIGYSKDEYYQLNILFNNYKNHSSTHFFKNVQYSWVQGFKDNVIHGKDSRRNICFVSHPTEFKKNENLELRYQNGTLQGAFSGTFKGAVSNGTLSGNTNVTGNVSVDGKVVMGTDDIVFSTNEKGVVVKDKNDKSWRIVVENGQLKAICLDCD